MACKRRFVPKGDKEGEYSNKFRAGLLEADSEAKRGELIPFEKIRKGILKRE
jgi:hypothetical protein